MGDGDRPINRGAICYHHLLNKRPRILVRHLKVRIRCSGDPSLIVRLTLHEIRGFRFLFGAGRALLDDATTIDFHADAGHKRGGGISKKDGGVSHVGRNTETARRNTGPKLLPVFRRVWLAREFGEERFIGDGGIDGVGTDAIGGQFHSQIICQQSHRAF